MPGYGNETRTNSYPNAVVRLEDWTGIAIGLIITVVKWAKSQALLTKKEREQIAGEHGKERRYQATSRIRRRIEEELTKDIEVLEEHHPDLLEELREVVCDD